MIILMKITQILINIICIMVLIIINNNIDMKYIDMHIVFGIVLLINTCMSIATIFYEKSKKKDKIMMVFNTMLIFMVAQIYTAITGIFSCNDWSDVFYKSAYFCLNAIMMGATFDAYKKYNEQN